MRDFIRGTTQPVMHATSTHWQTARFAIIYDCLQVIQSETHSRLHTGGHIAGLYKPSYRMEKAIVQNEAHSLL